MGKNNALSEDKAARYLRGKRKTRFRVRQAGMKTMNTHTESFRIEPGTSPRSWYGAACAEQGILPDEAQAAAIAQLDDLWQQLIEFKSRRNRDRKSVV